MKAEIKKVEKTWTIIITREGGDRNDYRFSTKAEALRWAKFAGLKF